MTTTRSRKIKSSPRGIKKKKLLSPSRKTLELIRNKASKGTRSILSYFSPPKKCSNSVSTDTTTALGFSQSQSPAMTNSASTSPNGKKTIGNNLSSTLASLKPQKVDGKRIEIFDEKKAEQNTTCTRSRSLNPQPKSSSRALEGKKDTKKRKIMLDDDIVFTSTKTRNVASKSRSLSSKPSPPPQMALIRVEKTTTNLEELCQSLHDPSTTHGNNLHVLYPKGVLGRDDSKKKKTNKIYVGIPMHENGVSRDQIIIESINPAESHSSDRKLRSLGRNSNPAETPFTKMTSSNLCNFLKHSQDQSATVTIRNKAMNAMLINKARVKKPAKIHGTKEILMEHMHRLDTEKTIILKVGDSIIFDAYNYKIDVNATLISSGGSAKRQSVSTPGCKYVYRLVSFLPVKDENAKAEEDPLVKKCKVEGIVEEEGKDTVLLKLEGVMDSEVQPTLNIDAGEKRNKLEEEENLEIAEEPVSEEEKLENDEVIQSKECNAEIAEDPTFEKDVLECVPQECIDSKEGNVKILKKPASRKDTLEKVEDVHIEPKEGDKFQMLFKQHDLFGKQIKMWFVGTVLSSKRNRKKGYKLRILWGDQSPPEEVDYPKKELERYPQNLLDLDNYCVGDHVECYYQNGASRGQTWPGRVAAVNADRTRVDVAYFDGEYEIGVPLHEGKIHLCMRGYKETEWLIDAEYPVGNVTSRSRRSQKLATVVNVFSKDDDDAAAEAYENFAEDWSENFCCEIRKPCGELEKQSYVNVVKAVFSNLKSKKQEEGKIKFWPGYETFDDAKMNTGSDDDSVYSEFSIERARSEIIEVCQDPMHKSLNPFAAVALGMCYVEEDDDDRNGHDFSQDSFFDFDEKVTDTNGPLVLAMETALANSCWRSLNSAEVQNGFGILTHLASAWNEVPNEMLAEKFSNFLLDGPESENIKIREPHRAELGFFYMEKATTLKRDGDDHKGQIGLPNDKDLDSLLSLPLREQDRVDPMSMSDLQTYRLFQSLQFCSESLGFAARSVGRELKGIISEQVEPSVKMVSSMTFSSVFLKYDIRESLKLVTRNMMKTLLLHGHWIIGEPGEGGRKIKTPWEQQCANKSQSCFNAFGTLLVYVAWLYCAKEEVPFGDHSCCYIIKDVVESELANMDFNRSGGKRTSMKVKNKYKRDMKLRFVISMDREFSSKLQIELSRLLNLSTEAALIFE